MGENDHITSLTHGNWDLHISDLYQIKTASAQETANSLPQSTLH